jgi:hypothetical protein
LKFDRELIVRNTSLYQKRTFKWQKWLKNSSRNSDRFLELATSGNPDRSRTYWWTCSLHPNTGK